MAFNQRCGCEAAVRTDLHLCHRGGEERGSPSWSAPTDIGLVMGILIFFNHFGKKRFSQDPTPIEVQMRTYEGEIQSAWWRPAPERGGSWMWMQQILLGILGLSAGITVAGGLFSFLVELGVVADFADRTHTGEHVLLYETRQRSAARGQSCLCVRTEPAGRGCDAGGVRAAGGGSSPAAGPWPGGGC